MSFTITLSPLVGNAFIILRKNGSNDDFIPFSKLEKYGDMIIQNLKKKGLDGYMCLNRDLTDEFFDGHQDLFIPMKVKGENGVGLIKPFEKILFVKRFQGYLPLDLLLAFLSDEAIKVLISKK